MDIKCKMCGSTLHVNDDEKVVTCEVCGSEQTVPTTNDTHEIELFNDANNYRLDNRFDKAIEVYKQIINEYPNQYEALWGLLISEYGIEYVDDFEHNKKVPTCHRTKEESILDNENYKKLLKIASSEEIKVYKEEASKIDILQKEILRYANECPDYDIFICYKENDFDGNRTKDSQYAYLIYKELMQRNYKVFFARETLRDVIGNYEPYIYSALSKSEIMILIGSELDFIEAPWVRNEWSRFLEICDKNPDRRIAPLIGLDNPYDLPVELKRFQAQNLKELDYLPVLLDSVDKFFSLKNKNKNKNNESKKAPIQSKVEPQKPVISEKKPAEPDPNEKLRQEAREAINGSNTQEKPKQVDSGNKLTASENNLINEIAEEKVEHINEEKVTDSKVIPWSKYYSNMILAILADIGTLGGLTLSIFILLATVNEIIPIESSITTIVNYLIVAVGIIGFIILSIFNVRRIILSIKRKCHQLTLAKPYLLILNFVYALVMIGAFLYCAIGIFQ